MPYLKSIKHSLFVWKNEGYEYNVLRNEEKKTMQKKKKTRQEFTFVFMKLSH